MSTQRQPRCQHRTNSVDIFRNALRRDSGHCANEVFRQYAVAEHRAFVARGGLPGNGAQERFARRSLFAGDAPRLPEVSAFRQRIDAAIRRIEQPRQFVEVFVLRAIEALESKRGGTCKGRVGKCGNDVGGTDMRRSDSEMNARGEQRIDETSRIADQYVTRPVIFEAA